MTEDPPSLGCDRARPERQSGLDPGDGGLVSTLEVVVVSGQEAVALEVVQAQALWEVWSWWCAETTEDRAS